MGLPNDQQTITCLKFYTGGLQMQVDQLKEDVANLSWQIPMFCEEKKAEIQNANSALTNCAVGSV